MASNKKTTPLIKISDEDVKEAGILTENPKVRDDKTDTTAKPKKINLIKIDEDYLEELRKEAEAIKGLPRPSMYSTRLSGVNQLYNIKKTTTTISRRSSNVNKEITKKSVNNIGKVLKAGGDVKESLKLIPIPPELLALVSTPESLEEEITKTHVRKQLFKMPASKASTSTKNFTSKVGTSGKYFKSPGSNSKPKISNRSPLLDMDRVKSVLREKSSHSSLETPKLFPSVQTPSRLSIVQEESSLSPSTSGNTSQSMVGNQRSSTSSNSEFEAIEQMCIHKNMNDEMKKILGMLMTDQEEFEKYNDGHNRRMTEISGILNKIISSMSKENISENNKENSIERRSKPKTPIRTTSKTDVIPNKSFDLRKNLLTMNLTNTPKEKRAEKMYNSLREKYGVLETPKFDKKTPKSDTTPKSGAKSISARIQEQCLLLLDTPQSKK